MSDEDIDRLHAAFLAMNPQEIAALKEQAEKARAAAMQWPPFAIFLSHEFTRIGSQCSAQHCAEATYPNAAGFEYLLELEMLKELQSPRVASLEALYTHLKAAQNDPVVRANPDAVFLVDEFSYEVAFMASTRSRESAFSEIKHEAAKSAISQQAAQRARSKNIAARAWVLTQWAARTDKGQSKASFARQHAMLVKHSFDVDVLPDQIAREWLPKKSKSGS